jgi:hypothetical protein
MEERFPKGNAWHIRISKNAPSILALVLRAVLPSMKRALGHGWVMDEPCLRFPTELRHDESMRIKFGLTPILLFFVVVKRM